MLLAPVLAEGGFNWAGLAIALVVLAIGWTILRYVLRLTMKIFALGSIALLVLVGIAFVLLYGK
jgi:hypothetical protein